MNSFSVQRGMRHVTVTGAHATINSLPASEEPPRSSTAQAKSDKIASLQTTSQEKTDKPFFTGVWNHSAPPSLNLPREIPLLI